MRQLLLMRHAKAVRELGLPDHARHLTERGRADAVLVARYLQSHGLVPSAAIASDARRTRETLELAATIFDPVPQTKLEPALYLAEPRSILAAIRAAPPSAEKVLIVGHNPGVAELAVALAGRGAPAQVKRLTESFPTCAVAVIEFECGWSEIEELAGRLERFVLAKPLREAAMGVERDAERET